MPPGADLEDLVAVHGFPALVFRYSGGFQQLAVFIQLDAAVPVDHVGHVNPRVLLRRGLVGLGVGGGAVAHGQIQVIRAGVHQAGAPVFLADAVVLVPHDIGELRGAEILDPEGEGIIAGAEGQSLGSFEVGFSGEFQGLAAHPGDILQGAAPLRGKVKAVAVESLVSAVEVQ